MTDLLRHSLIVITTTYEDISFRYFETNLIGCLKKPIDPKNFGKVMHKLKEMEDVYSTRLKKKDESPVNNPGQKIHKVTVDKGNTLGFIDLQDIFYFKADHKYTIAHTFDNTYLLNKSLNFLEEKLPDDFVRVHRSYLVNLNCVGNLLKCGNGKYDVVINDKSRSRLPMSRQGRSKLTNSFII
jgi:DNA-binding LytR/AlgR family response regulator